VTQTKATTPAANHFQPDMLFMTFSSQMNLNCERLGHLPRSVSRMLAGVC
jgi:hypothetical protein